MYRCQNEGTLCQAYILYLNSKLPFCLRPRPRPLTSPVYIINSRPQQLHIRISSQQLEISSNSSSNNNNNNNNKESVSEVRVSVESAPALVIFPLNQNRDRRLRILDLKDEQEAEVNIDILLNLSILFRLIIILLSQSQNDVDAVQADSWNEEFTLEYFPRFYTRGNQSDSSSGSVWLRLGTRDWDLGLAMK